MINALLKRQDLNVIFTDWSKGAKQLYTQAAGNCRLVGKQVSNLLEVLHNVIGLRFSSVHLIGFSLGAQVAGYAGRNLRQIGHTVRRITGGCYT